MALGIGSSNSVSIEAIQQRLAPSLQASEKKMAGLLSSMGPDASAQDLLQAQTAVSQWTLQAQLQSSLVKECGDALKGIIQKSG